MKKVQQINIKENMTVAGLIDEMGNAGVMGAGRMAKAVEIASAVIKDDKCKVFFGLAGAMVPGGMKNIVVQMLQDGWIDVLVTTGANLTHDLVEALGHNHYQGNACISDKELHEKGIDRIYDSFMPNKVYEAMEDFFKEHFDKLKDEKDIKSFLWKLGSLLPKGSILNTCYEKKIPVFCPGIADSGIGLMIWGHLAKGEKIGVGAFEDLKEILDIAWTSEKSAVWYLGGGVPKNYIQQAMQFSPKSAEFGIQITMDRPEPGGSSGAELREGISWGKMNCSGKFVDVICDATIALPLIVSALKGRI